MELLWSTDTKNSTLHNQDFVSAQWALATWMANQGRQKADALAGTNLPSCRPLPSFVSWGSSGTATSEWDSKEIEGLAARTKTCRAPVFNLVDENDTTIGELTKAIAEVVGCKYGFAGTLLSQFAKVGCSIFYSCYQLVILAQLTA